SAILSDAGALVGEVVMSAISGNGVSELLAIVKNASVSSPLTLEENGPPLHLLELPYALDSQKEE
ncbi:MAG: hypothetical protein Q8J78_10625, partial [Moraxellaceae bacterium]|nr:hypothetical protein [Moraxellaceae bacterium]